MIKVEISDFCLDVGVAVQEFLGDLDHCLVIGVCVRIQSGRGKDTVFGLQATVPFGFGVCQGDGEGIAVRIADTQVLQHFFLTDDGIDISLPGTAVTGETFHVIFDDLDGVVGGDYRCIVGPGHGNGGMGGIGSAPTVVNGVVDDHFPAFSLCQVIEICSRIKGDRPVLIEDQPSLVTLQDGVGDLERVAVGIPVIGQQVEDDRAVFSGVDQVIRCFGGLVDRLFRRGGGQGRRAVFSGLRRRRLMISRRPGCGLLPGRGRVCALRVLVGGPGNGFVQGRIGIRSVGGISGLYPGRGFRVRKAGVQGRDITGRPGLGRRRVLRLLMVCFRGISPLAFGMVDIGSCGRLCPGLRSGPVDPVRITGHFMGVSLVPEIVPFRVRTVMEVAYGCLVIGFPPFGLPLLGLELILLFLGCEVEPRIRGNGLAVLLCHGKISLSRGSGRMKKAGLPLAVVFGNPAVPNLGTRGFPSPPHDGFGSANISSCLLTSNNCSRCCLS